MTLLGIILLVVGAWTLLENQGNYQRSQAVSGTINVIIGAILMLFGSTTWLDRWFL